MMLSSKVIGRDSVKQQHPHTQPGEKNIILDPQDVSWILLPRWEEGNRLSRESMPF